ncbi:glycosyltransferase [Candidatus Pristimantibacillus sp. PTI5]|uniref:glycosyltransferase n=1 Tax=Candidatus Pristimantibacillus sp. PTI5 TaxID=3400422 RepID=UPI003B025DA1
MKKKLLFVMNNLNCGGAEKSLISLLQTIDYSSHDVDLFLFKHEGMFMNKVPKEVKVLIAPEAYPYFEMSMKTAIVKFIKKKKFSLIYARLRAGLQFKIGKNGAISEQRAWKYISKALPMLDTEYDAAIGYLEKNPIYFVIDKVKARKKLGYIHSDYEKLGMDPLIDERYFPKLDHIVTVSEECVSVLRRNFPELKHKIELMYNIISPVTVREMAEEDIIINKNLITITSVGRLMYLKGFSLAIGACEKLIKEGYDIKWFIVGDGQEREKLEQLIAEKQIEHALILTGQKENPYPYMKQCDLYVQTSLSEGRCLTITEAKILNKPIVSTNFNVIYEQLRNEENGLIVEQDAESIYNGIKRLIDNSELRQYLVNNLTKEELGNEEEINKLYQWIS